MEGISGITQHNHVMCGNALYPIGCELMEMDINACIEGCFKAGADKVIVRDGHSDGVNVNPLKIDQRAELIQGGSGNCRSPGIDDCDALILLGYHAMAGTAKAVLEHTFSAGSIQNMWLNGKLVGEFGIDATIAAEHKIPTIMVSGDDKICAEAKAFMPEIVTCQVKTAISLFGAQMLSPQNAHKLITAKTMEAIAQIGSVALPEVVSPVKLRRELVERGVPPVSQKEGVRLIDARTYEVSRNTLEAALFD